MEEMESVVQELRLRGMRSTPQRRAIVAEVLASEGHINPTDLIARVQSQIDGVNPSTVYRTLTLLEELGVLRHSHLEEGVEYHKAENTSHVHLICSEYGRTESLPEDTIEPFVTVLEKRSGYVIDPTHFCIAGVCAACRKSAGHRSKAGSKA